MRSIRLSSHPSLSGSGAQTDTQLRDSSQTGHVSPYAQAAQRLGINPSGDDSAADASQTLSDGSFRSALPGSSSGQQSATGDTYQSSWGGSSSFGGSPEAQMGGESQQSSWGTGRLHAARSVAKQSDSLRANPSLNGELANSDSAGYGSGLPNANASSSVGRYGRMDPSSSRRPGLQPGVRSANSSQNSQLRSTTQSSSMQNKPEELTHNDATSSTASGTGVSGGAASAGGGNGKGNTSAAANALTFFPAAYAEPFTLGRSPFSSPTGPDELHFLSPNIFAATSRGQAISLTGSRNSDATDNSLRQAFVHRHTQGALASAGDDRLRTHLAGSGSLNHKMGQSPTGTGKRTHLPTGILDSDNP